MLRIHQAVEAGNYPNTSTLSRELEVSPKSVQRDIEFMRDRMGLPIAYDGARYGYHYTEKVRAFPTLQITEGELAALIIAEKALQQYRGTQFEKPLLSAIRKIEQSLPDTITLNLCDLDQTISFRTRAQPILNLEILEVLAKAAAKQKQLELFYRKPGGKHVERRLVDPYHLANINGEWFLFAFDHARKDLRTFVPARVKSARVTGQGFSRPTNFSLESQLRDSFGVCAGRGRFLVVLRFTAAVADYIREKQWHGSQSLRELRDGGVEMRLRLSSLQEVLRWLLSWGGEVRVKGPAELRLAVREAARRLLAMNR